MNATIADRLADLEQWAEESRALLARVDGNLAAAASVMGRNGGKAKSKSKTVAARKNAAKGGRPRKIKPN